MNKKNLQTGFKIFITIGIFWYLFNNYSQYTILNLKFQLFHLCSWNKIIKYFRNCIYKFICFFKLKTKISYTQTLKIHTFSLLGNSFSFAKSGTAYKAFILIKDFNLNLKEFSLFFILNQLVAVFSINLLSLIYFSNINLPEINLIFLE